MAPTRGDSSPTMLAPPFSRLPSPPASVYESKDDFLSRTMEDESSSDSGRTGALRQPGSDESTFFDLQPPTPATKQNGNIEDMMARLTSAEHLNFILDDQSLFSRFSAFLNQYFSHMVPTLIRYLEMRKAVKAIEFANAVARGIRWPSHTDTTKFSRIQAGSVNVRFEDYVARELLLLCSEALPAFVTHTIVDVVADCVSKDISGQVIPVVRDLVGNLAEVFCLTDPSLHDNPIVYASEEFHRTTQYGTAYAINRNCRFLQGPASDKTTTMRIARACSLGRECNELLLNYRRDGTPFINLLMSAPLYDDRGAVRYFIGAQIDVTGLIEEGMGVESFRALLQKKEQDSDVNDRASECRSYDTTRQKRVKDTLDRLQELSQMFSHDETEVVTRIARSDDSTDTSSVISGVPTSVKYRQQAKRVIGAEEMLGDGLNLSSLTLNNNPGHTLPGAYQHYLLVRPAPSLQIIFVSPSLRLPGLLRTHLFSKLGGPAATINALQGAFRDGASVTAKVLWLPRNASSTSSRGAEVRPRRIRCTPLLGSDDRVGVWMIVLVPIDTGGLASKAYGRREHVGELVDEVAVERMRLSDLYRSASVTPTGDRPNRNAGSDLESDGGRRDGRSPSVDLNRGKLPAIRSRSSAPSASRRMRGGVDGGLYADYLKQSSSPSKERVEKVQRESGLSEGFGG